MLQKGLDSQATS